MSQDWDIKPRNKECGACQTPFNDRQAYFAQLVFGEQGYQRADFCATCWPQQMQAQPHYSMWKGIFRVPPPEPERRVKKETAEGLLRELITADDATKGNVIYILAVMLERQRVLVEREVRTREDHIRFVIYEHRKSGESFVIRDPQLRLDQLESVQIEVLALLGATPRPAPVDPAQPANPEEAAGPAEPAAPPKQPDHDPERH